VIVRLTAQNNSDFVNLPINRAAVLAPTVRMATKTHKRGISEREKDELEGSTPAKRLRVEQTDPPEGKNGIVESPLEQDDEEGQIVPIAPAPVVDDLYLETVNRSMLEFDFERVCSVTLTNLNVYGCLVCGKYFSGRGKATPAYAHSLGEDHHVYINLQTLKVYVLPENYEVKSAALDDIKYVVNPTFTKQQVAKLDKDSPERYSLANEKYIPGFVGLNNLKANDYMNAVVQILTHVSPLRNFFILEPLDGRPELVRQFSSITRKIWNQRAFKGHVSPHEFLQQILSLTKNLFKIDEQGDPAEFLMRLLNDLHRQLGGNPKKQGSSIIYKLFQGQVHMQSQEIVVGGGTGDVEGRESRLTFVPGRAILDRDVQFLLLTLDLPPAPLFQDAIEKNIIPQVDIYSLLSKYDGRTSQELAGERRRFKISKLPPYMIFHIKRLKRTDFTVEHNPTIVTFPITSLDMKEYAYSFAAPPGTSTMYDLIGNITLESMYTPGGQEKRVYKAQVKDFSRDQWYVIQDLIVEVLEKERMHLAESYIQVWQRQKKVS
jgi:U4/U6.U5 tri-snRNP-associated protein 2